MCCTACTSFLDTNSILKLILLYSWMRLSRRKERTGFFCRHLIWVVGLHAIGSELLGGLCQVGDKTMDSWYYMVRMEGMDPGESSMSNYVINTEINAGNTEIDTGSSIVHIGHPLGIGHHCQCIRDSPHCLINNTCCLQALCNCHSTFLLRQLV